MHDIVESVARVTDVISEISAGAKEQSSSIGQINTAVAEMDTMTQQNAVMVQQTSSAASEMSRHAQRLNRLINSFVLGGEDQYGDTPEVSNRVKGRPSMKSQIISTPQTTKPLVTLSPTTEEWEEF